MNTLRARVNADLQADCGSAPPDGRTTPLLSWRPFPERGAPHPSQDSSARFSGSVEVDERATAQRTSTVAAVSYVEVRTS